MSQIPEALRPESGERGILSRNATEATSRALAAWDQFLAAAENCDLEAQSRSASKRGLDIVLPLGAWPQTRSMADVLADMEGDRSEKRVDQEAAERLVLETHGSTTATDAIDAVRGAREDLATFLETVAAKDFFEQITASPLGPLPLLTVINAAAYQLAVSALDLVPCGADVDPKLLHAGVIALVDTTGALAHRQGLTGSITALLPEGSWGFGSTPDGWRTAPIEYSDDPQGPAVQATAKVLLDVTSGRETNVAALWSQRELLTHDLSGLLIFASVVDQVPGLPGGTALRAAARTIGGVGKLLGRLRLPGF